MAADYIRYYFYLLKVVGFKMWNSVWDKIDVAGKWSTEIRSYRLVLKTRNDDDDGHDHDYDYINNYNNNFYIRYTSHI